MEEKEISSPEESLEIIRLMVEKAKSTVVDNSFLFLLWGWFVLACSLGQYFLKVVYQKTYHYYPWALLIIALVIPLFRGRRKKSQTYVDYTIENTWIGILISYVLFTAIFFRIGWDHCYPFYIFLMSLGGFLTGKFLDFNPLVVGGIGGAALALLTAFLDFDQDILVCCLAILICYIIPGYMLRSRYKAGIHVQ